MAELKMIRDNEIVFEISSDLVPERGELVEFNSIDSNNRMTSQWIVKRVRKIYRYDYIKCKNIEEILVYVKSELDD